MNYKDKSILVTGGNGLVGSALVDKLQRLGARVNLLIYDKKYLTNTNSALNYQTNIFYGNLKNPTDVNHAVLQSEATVFFHLGAQTLVRQGNLDPVDTFEANIQGTWNILDSIRRNVSNVEAVVVASSDKAYGASETLPYTEDTPLHGISPYEVSKSCTDLIAQSFGITYALPLAIARCGNIFGQGDLNWSRIVPGTLKSIFTNEVPVLRGDGGHIRDYIYIDDVVEAYLTLANNLITNSCRSVAYNFSTDVKMTTREIYDLVCFHSIGKLIEPVIMDNAKNEIRSQHLSSQKAKSELGWSAKFGIEEGLDLTIKWYRKYFEGLNVK